MLNYKASIIFDDNQKGMNNIKDAVWFENLIWSYAIAYGQQTNVQHSNIQRLFKIETATMHCLITKALFVLQDARVSWHFINKSLTFLSQLNTGVGTISNSPTLLLHCVVMTRFKGTNGNEVCYDSIWNVKNNKFVKLI